MPNKLAHFAIEAEDVNRARLFYEKVFEWRFEPWGPPEFYLIHNAGIHGALQKRQVPLPEGRKGFECSIAVNDLDKSMTIIQTAGGTIIGTKHTIPSIGSLVQFLDTEDNQAIIVQYEADRLKELGLD